LTGGEIVNPRKRNIGCIDNGKIINGQLLFLSMHFV